MAFTRRRVPRRRHAGQDRRLPSCHHRIAAAKELVKYGSKDAARFIVQRTETSHAATPPVRSALNPARPLSQRPDATGQKSACPEHLYGRALSLSTVEAACPEAPSKASLVLSTVEGPMASPSSSSSTPVLQHRTEGPVLSHRRRIACPAKQLVVQGIVRDETPEPAPGEAPSSVHPEPVLSTVEGPVEGPSSVRPEPVLSTVEGPVEGAGPDDPAHTIVIPAEAGTHPRPRQARPEPAEGPQDTVRRPRRRRPRKQRRQEGAARAAILGKHPISESNNKEEQDKPAPVELTPAERRIKERLEQHWREPDPYGAPIDSTHPGRSPPW